MNQNTEIKLRPQPVTLWSDRTLSDGIGARVCLRLWSVGDGGLELTLKPAEARDLASFLLKRARQVEEGAA